MVQFNLQFGQSFFMRKKARRKRRNGFSAAGCVEWKWGRRWAALDFYNKWNVEPTTSMTSWTWKWGLWASDELDEGDMLQIKSSFQNVWIWHGLETSKFGLKFQSEKTVLPSMMKYEFLRLWMGVEWTQMFLEIIFSIKWAQELNYPEFETSPLHFSENTRSTP